MKGGRFRSLRWKGSRNVRWNYADVYEAIARVMPDVPCQVQGDRSISWDEFDRRSNALANAFLAAGLSSQAKVAVYLRNCPDYLQNYCHTICRLYQMDLS